MENIVEIPDQERSKSADLLICDCFQVKASAIHEAINEGMRRPSAKSLAKPMREVAVVVASVASSASSPVSLPSAVPVLYVPVVDMSGVYAIVRLHSFYRWD